MVKKSFVSAPGKIILSGEHSVVHGQPAILTAIDRRLFVEIEKSKNDIEIITDEPIELAEYALEKTSQFLGKKVNNLRIKIRSEIPVNRGLGSSAALSVAMTGVLFSWWGKDWNKDFINRIAYEIEKKQHQNPSGADNSVVCFGGLIIFQKGKIKKLNIAKMPDFVLLDSGRAFESTGEMVSLASRQSPLIFKKIGKLTLRLIEVLKTGHFENLKDLILDNERLLETLGVVGNKAKRIIREIESLGGAAKVCGAGGIKSGSGVLLCWHQNPRIILNFAGKNKIKSFKATLREEGLRDEN